MWRIHIAGAFLFNGLMSVTGKMLEEMGLGEFLWTYLFSYHLSALILVSLLMARKRISPDTRELLTGGAIGLTSLGGLACMLKALQYTPGVMVFSLVWGGSVILTALLDVLFFKEKIGLPEWIGIGLGIAAFPLLASG